MKITLGVDQLSENELRAKTFLILDCQTTAMRPSVGHLLEFAWSFATADSEVMDVHSSLIQLPAGESVPLRVKEITGIRNSDMELARELDSVRDDFKRALVKYSSSSSGERIIALIHYAQFEEAWLKSLLEVDELPFDLLCTHRLSKKLFPQVPSRNVRGLTGFFGMRIGEIKRAAQHVLATQKIWSGIVDALTERQITSIGEIRAYLNERPAKKSSRVTVGEGTSGAVTKPSVAYEYRVDRAKRLALPAKPGIYRMLAKSGEILYVGKATSLKDRVNSYFRGKKGRDSRKLELMAQVWDFETQECDSAIEAALIESDEIKRLNPPYNVSLKDRGRNLIYYDRELATESLLASNDHPIGPFRRFNSVEHLRTFAEGLKKDLICNVFYQPIESETLEAGYELFAAKYSQFRPDFTVRDHLAFALRLLRLLRQASSVDDDVSQDYSAEEIMEKIENLYLHAASTYLRTKSMTRLLWADISWIESGDEKQLMVRHGKIGDGDVNPAPQCQTPLWQGLAVSDYDRMSVLLTEITKVAHKIKSVRHGNPVSSN